MAWRVRGRVWEGLSEHDAYRWRDQALQLTGVSHVLQARASPFYSKREPFLVGEWWVCEW